MISLIVAIDKNRGIGYKNKLLWTNKEDMKIFRDVTFAKNIVMGSNTYLSIGKILPFRTNYIVSNNEDIRKELKNEIGAFCISHKEIKNLIEKFKNSKEELVVIGGERIYNEFLEYVDEFHMTYINKKFYKIDRYFPEIDLTDFEVKQVIDNKEFIYKYYKRKWLNGLKFTSYSIIYYISEYKI